MMEEKRVWTKEKYVKALNVLGVTTNEAANEVTLDKLVTKTLRERNETKDKAVIDPLRDKLYDEVSVVAEEKVEEKVEEPKQEIPADFLPECPAFGSCDLSSPDCKTCQTAFVVEHGYCLIKTESTSTAKKKTKAERKPRTPRVPGEKRPLSTIKGTYKDFDGLKAHIAAFAGDRPTNYLDKLLLEGKSYAELLTLCQAKREELGTVGLDKLTKINAHINYREKHDGWVFKRDAETIQLVGYSK